MCSSMAPQRDRRLCLLPAVLRYTFVFVIFVAHMAAEGGGVPVVPAANGGDADGAANDGPFFANGAVGLHLAARCDRCDGAHPTVACPLIGLGIIQRARYATQCCHVRCQQWFIHDGPVQQRSRIISIGDMGYMHTACALQMVEPYDGMNAQTFEERCAELCNDVPPSIQQVRMALASSNVTTQCSICACACVAHRRFAR